MRRAKADKDMWEFHIYIQIFHEYCIIFSALNNIRQLEIRRYAVSKTQYFFCLIEQSPPNISFMLQKKVCNYSTRVPNQRACTRYLILTKLPLCTLLLGSARLFIFWIFETYLLKIYTKIGLKFKTTRLTVRALS